MNCAYKKVTVDIISTSAVQTETNGQLFGRTREAINMIRALEASPDICRPSTTRCQRPS